MEPNPQEAFDLSLGNPASGYDPLVGHKDNDDDPEDLGGQQKPLAGHQSRTYGRPTSDSRSVAQRIEGLFAALAPRRRVLLAILRMLDAPKRSELLQQSVDELQANDLSVYSGYNFSLLLAEAGAIQKVHEDGSAFDEKAEQLPDIVEVDGVKFFKPTNGKQVFWLITDDGRAYIEADNPFGRLEELITGEPHYRTVYKGLLEFCDNESGRSVKELEELVDNDPLVQDPRRYFSYFVKNLEDCAALSWVKKWHTTELGKKGLELLFAENGEATTEGEAEQLMGVEQR